MTMTVYAVIREKNRGRGDSARLRSGLTAGPMRYAQQRPLVQGALFCALFTDRRERNGKKRR